MEKKRILTGDRPTNSRFHLGNYVGSLKARLEFQDEYEEFIMVADLHALTTHAENTRELKTNIHELALNYLAVGLNPQKVTFFRQSRTFIPELALILGMFTPLSLLQRQPALKEKLAQGSPLTYGLLGYPVLMAADILGVDASLVPVGKDQKAHVEFARDIAQKVNALYGRIFTLPEPFIGEGGTLVGTDGKQKMSKSLNNAIFLLDSEKEIKAKVTRMYTDPTRIHVSDPGHVEGNPVFTYLDFFSEHTREVEELKKRYREGKVSDKDVKETLANILCAFLAPIRERYEIFKKKESIVGDILLEGEKRASLIINKTLESVKDVMGL